MEILWKHSVFHALDHLIIIVNELLYLTDQSDLLFVQKFATRSQCDASETLQTVQSPSTRVFRSNLT